MSVEQNSGMQKTVRQFLVALTACLAVAGAAVYAVSPGGAPESPVQHAGVTVDWPHTTATATPAPPVN
ncbi:hypothetical protein GCM10017562_42600 [Streptomyces roseofulvus]|uniref:Lipoprotein n=2 Tax=Streptomyces TaxID=1883 RepID=A0ABU4KD67_9ACTN|nr:hypothetical protein [Streptomyces roseolus]MDX2295723.1 hypothetical protein [Streptomyces roseolus]